MCDIGAYNTCTSSTSQMFIERYVLSQESGLFIFFRYGANNTRLRLANFDNSACAKPRKYDVIYICYKGTHFSIRFRKCSLLLVIVLTPHSVLFHINHSNYVKCIRRKQEYEQKYVRSHSLIL